MKNIKEVVASVEKWIEENQEIVEKVKNNQEWNSPLEPFKRIIYWYEEAKNNQLILGDKIITFEELHKLLPSELNYATEKTITSVIAGDWDDDVRWDEIDRSLRYISDEIFNYVYYTLKWDKDKFEDNLYNSMQFNDELLDLFPPDISILNSEKEQEKVKVVIEKIDLNTPRKINEFLLKYPKELEESLKELKHLHFVGYSRIDGNPVYQLELPLPENFEIINSIKSHIENV